LTPIVFVPLYHTARPPYECCPRVLGLRVEQRDQRGDPVPSIGSSDQREGPKMRRREFIVGMAAAAAASCRASVWERPECDLPAVGG
jgi:hypothetical protein